MLKELKKVFGGKQEEQLEEVVATVVEANMNIEQSLGAELQEALSQIETLNAVLAEKETLLAEMASKLEALSSFAAEAEARAEAIAKEAKAKELADKKAMLAEVIGADNPNLDNTFAAIEGLDASAFSVVVEGFKASLAKEAESPSFTQQSVSGEAEVKAESSALNISNFIQKKKGK